jgi:hypothetical protein
VVKREIMAGEDSNHKCIHEKEITLLVDHSNDMARDLHNILDTIKGNGKPGLVTEMALQKQCMEKLHQRVDGLTDHLEKLVDRAAVCESNDKAIGRIWKVLLFGGGPVVTTVVGGIIKIAFFGG